MKLIEPGKTRAEGRGGSPSRPPGSWHAILWCCAASVACGATLEQNRAVVERMPGLVAFWTFGEPAGTPRRSSGTKQAHPLQEVGGPIPRMPGGPFSGFAAELDGGDELKNAMKSSGAISSKTWRKSDSKRSPARSPPKLASQ